MVLVSVIIPVFEQWDRMGDLLAALDRQTLARSTFEIIVVDNGSTAIHMPDNRSDNLELVTCAQPGAYAARNAGLAHAIGQWIAFTDADCLPAPDWLESLLRAAGEGGEKNLVAGRVEMVPASTDPTVWEVYDLVKGIPQARYVNSGYAATANLMAPRAALDAVGGFDAARMSGGDAAFCRAAQANGYGIIYAPDAVVRHPARGTWHELVTKARRVKGGQMAPGTPLRYRLGTLLPPVPAIGRFLASREHPLRHRVTACMVQLALWGVECGEAIRLLAGGGPERR